MREQDPTPSPALKRLARNLGIEFDEFISTSDLGKLVTSKRFVAPPSPSQLRVAERYGITTYDARTTYGEMEQMIREAQRELSRQTLAERPDIAPGAYLVHGNTVVRVASISNTTYKVRLERVVPVKGSSDFYSRSAIDLTNARGATKAQLKQALEDYRTAVAKGDI